MSYTLDHNIPGLAELYKTLTGDVLDIDAVIKEKLKEKGFVVESEKAVLLYDGDICCNDVYGKEIVVHTIDNRGFQLDKKTYVPKLVKKYSSNGNYGLDTYAWKEVKDNNFKVEQESHGEISSEQD